MTRTDPPAARSPRPMQAGFTLVELLVAMALTLLVVLAATAMLVTARQGFSAADAASQLRDNARFAASIVQRIVDQAGFLDTTYAASSRSSDFKVAGLTTNPEPSIRGYNNASYAASRLASPTVAAFNDGLNGSDMLVVRYQLGTTFPGSTASDGTMISCAGDTFATAASSRFDRMASVFYVKTSPTSGEPTLMCAYRLESTATGPSAFVEDVPLVDGVETFQVLFGVDGVVAGQAASATADTVVDQYLRADQLTVAGNVNATYLNWQRVRSVRIGMVLRGPPRSASQAATPVQYPLGALLSSASEDAGSVRAAQSDGRLRQTVTFTLYLRNAQNL